MIYPAILNPTDAQGRTIFVAAHQGAGGSIVPFCYVEGSLFPQIGPFPAPSMAGPPGSGPQKSEVPCPQALLHPRWQACQEGRIVTNAATCPCACFSQPNGMPPTVFPTPCPPPPSY